MVCLPELLQCDGDLDAVGGLSGVEVDVGSFLIVYHCHLACDLLV